MTNIFSIYLRCSRYSNNKFVLKDYTMSSKLSDIIHHQPYLYVKKKRLTKILQILIWISENVTNRN